MGFVYAPRGAHSLPWTALRTQPSRPSYAPPTCSRWGRSPGGPGDGRDLEPGQISGSPNPQDSGSRSGNPRCAHDNVFT